MLAFVLSLDDFVISNFNSSTTVTYPLYVFGTARTGTPPEVNVLATMVFVLTLGAMFLLVRKMTGPGQAAGTSADA